jgi:hypothetical protein
MRWTNARVLMKPMEPVRRKKPQLAVAMYPKYSRMEMGLVISSLVAK